MKKDIRILNTILLCGILFFITCKKEARNVTSIPLIDSSHLSITNASPGTFQLQFYINDKRISLADSSIQYGQTTSVSYIRNSTTYFPDTVLLPYINIVPGFQQLNFKFYGSGDAISSLNNNFEAGTTYSFFIMDTLIHGKVASVLLKDQLIKTDSMQSQIRFLNLSADAPSMDVWAFPNGSSDGYKIFSNCGYLPNDFNSFINAQTFTLIDRGAYVFIATEAGTFKVLLSGQMIISGQRVITLYTKGYVSGSGLYSLDVGVIQYKP